MRKNIFPIQTIEESIEYENKRIKLINSDFINEKSYFKKKLMNMSLNIIRQYKKVKI